MYTRSALKIRVFVEPANGCYSEKSCSMRAACGPCMGWPNRDSQVCAYTQRIEQLAKAEYSPQSKLWPGVYSIGLSECFVRILTAVSWSLESVLHHGSIEGYSSCFDGPDQLSL